MIPTRADLAWSTDEAGIVTLHKENTGLFNKAAQKLLHKPRVSHIHLDKMGSFVWPRIDGQRTVGQLADLAAEQFGPKADPVRCIPAWQNISRFWPATSSSPWQTPAKSRPGGRPALCRKQHMKNARPAAVCPPGGRFLSISGRMLCGCHRAAGMVK